VPVLDRFRCHLVNAPGSGRTSPPADESGWDVEVVVDFYEAARVAIGLGPVTAMGHSWGGLVASVWAARHPESVAGLIVVDGYAGGGSVEPAVAAAERDRALDRLRGRSWFAEAWAALQHVDEAATEDEVAADFAAYFPFYFGHPEETGSLAHIERIRREQRWYLPALAAWTGAREDADYRGLLAGVRCPALVIVGEHDWICGPAWNRALADAIPGARLVVVPGVGHLPQYEAPAVFRAAIDDWLAE
jgi:pimeloyl-ACP methyl ester carboxylesterase